MKFERLPKAEVKPGDDHAMPEAIAFLDGDGFQAKRPSAYQLKLDERTSFYPTRGTLFIDGETGARPERGLAALKKWLGEQPVIFRVEIEAED